MTTTENALRQLSPTGVSRELADVWVQKVLLVPAIEYFPVRVSSGQVDQLLGQLRAPLPVETVEAIQDQLLNLAGGAGLVARVADEREPGRLREALIPVVARLAASGDFADEIRRVLCRLARAADSGIRHAVADALRLLPSDVETRTALMRLSGDPIAAVADAARASLDELSG